MKITREDVLRVAELAHLELTAPEVETFRDQLDSILEYVEKLNQLDTANVEPMAGGHPAEILNPSEILDLRSEIAPSAPATPATSGISNLRSERAADAPSPTLAASTRAAAENPAFRDDVPWPAPPILPADALRAAPDAASEPSGAFFRVPKVIER